MRKIVDYIVVYGEVNDFVEKIGKECLLNFKVNLKLNDGYDLYGFPYANRDDCHHQAMVKYEDEG